MLQNKANNTYIPDEHIKILDAFKTFEAYYQKWQGYKTDKKKYLETVDSVLDSSVYGQKEAKLQIKRIIAQWINGENEGYCFGFEGCPGVGKTSLAKKGIANCLVDNDGKPRPFAFIALGGSSNGTTLEGHSYTYVGSTWGRIVDILIETKCMNPIIFIDELDKVSRTDHGKEIIGILTHLTDSSQNNEFCDKYFAGIKLDLSKILFIFSYNDYSLLDPVLGDRIQRIKFKNLSKLDKIEIVNKHLLPEILDIVGFNKEEIIFPTNVIEFIIDNYTYEGGVRKLKEKLFEIIREINLRYLLGEMKYYPNKKPSISNKNINKNNKNNKNNNNKEFPINVSIAMIEDFFSDKPKIIHKKIAERPYVGLVNGLFATIMGVGGLTIIETFKTPSDSKMSLKLTGQQGDVMKESMQVAKTVAWNLIPNTIKQAIIDDKSDFGIHIHCPEASTPKDGPSAGTAITLAIVSLLCNLPVKNTVAMTGEIDLNGSIHAIGGLESKITGAKKAGVKTILCPEQNKENIDIIKKKENSPIDDSINIIMVKNIWEVLNISLIDHKLNFNRYNILSNPTS